MSNSFTTKEATKPNTVCISNTEETDSLSKMNDDYDPTSKLLLASPEDRSKSEFSNDLSHLIDQVRKDPDTKVFVNTKKDSVIGQDGNGKIFVSIKKRCVIETLFSNGTKETNVEEDDSSISSTSGPRKVQKISNLVTNKTPTFDTTVETTYKQETKESTTDKEVEEICEECETVVSRCDNVLYGKYCIKAVYQYYRERGSSHPFARREIKGIFYDAYHEVRRVHIQNKYGYFVGYERDLPKCMEDKSLLLGLSLIHNLCLGRQLNEENNKGGAEYLNGLKK